MTHVHSFALVDRAIGKYRCACGVLGRRKGSKIVALHCHHMIRVDGARLHCGADAVESCAIDRNANRCAEHARAGVSAAS